MEYIETDESLKFIRHSLWRISVIELSKLFNDRKSTDKLNLHHFIKKLKPDGHYKKFKVDSSILKEWVQAIEENKAVISDITTLRDKIYAHSDPNNSTYNTIRIYFDKVDKLLKLVETILSYIYLSVLVTTFDFEDPYFSRKDFQLVTILATEQKRRNDALLDGLRS